MTKLWRLLNPQTGREKWFWRFGYLAGIEVGWRLCKRWPEVREAWAEVMEDRG